MSQVLRNVQPFCNYPSFQLKLEQIDASFQLINTDRGIGHRTHLFH